MGLAAFGDANKFDYNKYNYDCKFYFKKNKNFFFLKTSGHPKLGNKKFVELENSKKISIAEHRTERCDTFLIHPVVNIRSKLQE